jgi:hypothetical protein
MVPVWVNLVAALFEIAKALVCWQWRSVTNNYEEAKLTLQIYQQKKYILD